MKKRNYFAILAMAGLMALPVNGQDVKLKGILVNNRHDDGEVMPPKYIGWSSELGKGISVFDHGIYSMTLNGADKIQPTKDPAVVIGDFYQNGQFTDLDKAQWATNFGLMASNSGSVYVDGKLTTVFSRDYQSTEPEEMFAVRQWDANSGDLLNKFPYFPETKILESAGMSYNPVDGKVYGLFYVTNAQLNEAITSDPDYFTEEDDQFEGREGVDAGYAIGTIDLETMDVKLITNGLYYYNFITFAINSEGRAFALTSGGANAALGDDGKYYNINNELAGAQLYEFNLETGNMMANPVEKVDETGETYVVYEPTVPATGYMSKVKRQAACFAKSNPNKMYWVGYFNSGKGINDWGSWGELSDKEWRTNGKYDTCLYEVDVNTGETTRVAMLGDRCTFSTLWVEGDDCSDGMPNEIQEVNTAENVDGNVKVYNTAGQIVFSGKAEQMNLKAGLYIVKNGEKTQKVLVK